MMGRLKKNWMKDRKSWREFKTNRRDEERQKERH